MKTGPTKTAGRLAGLALAAALALTACGDDADQTPADPSGGASDGQGTTTAPASATDSPEPSGSEDSGPEEADGADASASPSEEGADEDESEDPRDESTSSPEAGAGRGDATGPGEVPSSSSATGGSAGEEQYARLQEMAPSILLAEDLPGDVLVGQHRRAAVDEEFEMNMSVRGVETTGECGRLIEQIDTFSRSGSAAGFSQYEVDPDATGAIGAAEAFASAVITPGDEDVMGLFGRLPEVCGELSGPNATAVFEPIDGLPGASRLVMESGSERLEVLMGGVSDGNEHLYTGYVNIETELAEQMLRAQVAAFEARQR